MEAVLVAGGQIAGQVPPAGEAPPVAVVVVEVAAEHRRPRRAHRQHPRGVGVPHLDGSARVVEHRPGRAGGRVLGHGQQGQVDAGQRPTHRAGPHLAADEVRHHDPAGLGLPPGVEDDPTEHSVAPAHHLRVERFPHRGDDGEGRQVVLAGLVVAGGHQHAQRGGRGVPDRDALGGECRVPTTGVELALVDHDGDAVQERGEDPVGRAGHPPRVGGAPVHVVGVQVEGGPGRGVVDHPGAVDVQRPLRHAGGAGGEVQQRRVVGGGGGDGPLARRGGEERGEVVHAGRRVHEVGGVGTVHQEHVAQAGQVAAAVGQPLAVQRRRGEHGAGVAALEALAHRVGTEGGEQRAEHGADAEDAERPGVQLGTPAEQRGDHVAPSHAEMVEDLGKAAGVVRQLGVAPLGDSPVPVEEPQRRAVATRAGRVAVRGLVAEVEPAAGEAVECRRGVVPTERRPGGHVVDEVRHPPRRGPRRKHLAVDRPGTTRHRSGLHPVLLRPTVPSAGSSVGRPGRGRPHGCVA